MYFTYLFNDMHHMQNHMTNKRLSNFLREKAHSYTDFPQIQIYTNTDQLVVRTELPGLNQDEIQLNITDDVLMISGEIKNNPVANDVNILRREIKTGKFQKVIELPYPVNGNETNAVLKNGILTIMFPVKEKVKPRHIQIKSA